MGKKITLLVLSIILVLTILIGTTYSALFKVDEGVEQSYATGNLEIISNATNGSVTLTNSLPMEDSVGAVSTPYTFKITNTGNLSYNFNVKFLSTTTDLENMINPENIKIKVNDNEIMTFYSLSLNDGIILENIELAPSKSIEITIRVWLDINTQNTEIGKVFNAKIVTEGQAFYTIAPALNTLKKLGLEDKLKSGTPDFATIATTDEGIYAAQDDLGTTYYFRGASERNYVKFADKYWRIIRINGDGTVRMIYDGTSAHANGESSEDRSVGQSVFNSVASDNAFVGYMNGTTDGINFPNGTTTSTTYDEAHANSTDSTIKTYLEDTWYPTLSATDKEKIVDAIYCNDRSLDTSDANYTGIGKTHTYYAGFYRLFVLKSSHPEPTLKCKNPNDRFTLDSVNFSIETNGDLDAPVGLITADEVALAGIYVQGNNQEFYLHTGHAYWTMTPAEKYAAYDLSDVFIASGSGGSLGTHTGVSSSYFIRPVITLRSDALKYNGETSNGSKDYPFLVE